MTQATPILQFGTSRFLQAHADLFTSEALARGDALGRITVVQSSGDAGRSARLAALAAPGGYPVRIRGLQDGQVVDRTNMVTSIARTLSTATDWAEVCRIGCQEAQVILSNTADAGYAPQPADGGGQFDQAMSFPAKLAHLLQERFRAGAAPVQVMPMELVSRNGQVLKARVLELARGDGFRDWLQTQVTWVNSLVDRIVSEPIEPAGAVAEPYALWAIEAQPGLLLPCRHPSVQVVDRLEETESLKLFILNLGHSFLADNWLNNGRPDGALVRHVMENPDQRADLLALYETEVRPGFAAAGLDTVAAAYVAVTLERFSNPFLNHALSEIAQNHAIKVDRRINGFMRWVRSHGGAGAMPRLQAIADRFAAI